MKRIVVALILAGCAPAEDAPECQFDLDCPTQGDVCEAGACTRYCPDVEKNAQCLPDCGNEFGIGQPCTAGGGECNVWLEIVEGNFVVCTIDFVPDADLAMCTKPCVDDSDCGTDAVCIGDPEDPDSDTGCVPASCGEE